MEKLRINKTSPSAKTARPGRPGPVNSAAMNPLAENLPNTPRPGSAMRTPLRSASAAVKEPHSRSGTPTLVRKASMTSLHSVATTATTHGPSRRASIAHISSVAKSRSGTSPLRDISPEPIIIPTPHSVASAHFKAELDIHHGPEPTRRVETVVILQDACYGHRYSRPRASKSLLSTIVERPERIKACILGIAAAYVRLGERHQDGAFPIHPDSDPATLPTIPFRIQKSFRRVPLTSQVVTNVHGVKWMEELRHMCDTAETKLASGGKELERPDMDRGPNAGEPQAFHEGDLYLCEDSRDALEGALGGVCDAVDIVFNPHGPQRAFVAIRPPGHHCSASHPSGFCWINNVHVGIMHAILAHGLTHAAIIDFDLHHGDGSQAIAWQHNTRTINSAKNAALWKKTSIGYFSLHDINSFPCETGDEEKVRNASICIDNAHGQTVWNVHLEPWKTESDFWTIYNTKYSALLERARGYLKAQTEKLRAAGLNSKAAIFISAGFDASQWEDPGMQRHNVNVPTDFYAKFTRDIVRIAAEEGTSVEGRIISVLEGGYSDRALCSGVFAHLCGLAGDGASNEPRSRPASVDFSQLPQGTPVPTSMPLRGRKDSSASERGSRRYEPSWWSAAELERLEVTVATPAPQPRVIRNITPPTYSSPTQASIAKAKAPPRFPSAGLASNGAEIRSLPPSSPCLDIPWTIATHELSKLLIPTDRQTNSCTAEELNAEATRLRRERQIALGTLAPPPQPAVPPTVPEEGRAPTRTGLRERKPKVAEDAIGGDVESKSRRQTVAGAGDLSGKMMRATSRRLSAASAVASSSEVPARPPSSGSVSVAGSNGLTVKKTRSTATLRKEPSVASLKKDSTASTTAARTTIKVKKTPAVNGTTSDKKDGGEEVDKIAGDMKKIKITVIQKAQKDARERERFVREKLAQAQGQRTDAPASESIAEEEEEEEEQASTPQAQAPPAQPLPSPTPSLSLSPCSLAPGQTQSFLYQQQQVIHDQPSQVQTQEPGLASPPTSAPRTVPSSPASSVEPACSASISPGTDGQPKRNKLPDWPPKPLNQQASLPPKPQPMPIKRENLPIFSSKGHIPFAPRPEEQK